MRCESLGFVAIYLSEGVTSMREAARSGLGVALLPDWLILEDLKAGRLVRVLPPWQAKDLPVHVVYSADRLLPTRVRAFIDFSVNYMIKELTPKAARLSSHGPRDYVPQQPDR